MTSLTRAAAAVQVALVAPAVLFMASLFLRNVTPAEIEPARTAQHIVTWYTTLGPEVGLWLLLMAAPLAVFLLGTVVLVRSWMQDQALRVAARQALAALRSHLALAIIAASTAAAAGVLAIVAVHVLTD